MNKIKICILCMFLITSYKIISRNIHRQDDPKIGSIKVFFENNPKTYKLKSSYLREIPLFKSYNHEYFMSKKLPHGNIPFKYETEKSVDGKKLEGLIINLLKEINQGKKKFTDFKSLKNRDFNKFTKCGLLVLKFNDYPFILKIFIETPESFVKPLTKSFQVRGVFVLGGSFRHITGYTRIRNIDLIKEKIKNHSKFSNKIDFPRKWFWVPEKIDWIIVNGQNIGSDKEHTAKFPSIYAVITDEIKGEKKKSFKSREFLKLCSELEFILDPNPSNYREENGKITLIDTEHFSTLIGLDKKLKDYDKYSNYMPKIAGKYMKDRWFSSKEERYYRQKSKNQFLLFND